MSDTRPALEYLAASSDMSLESFALSRMNRAANLRKQVRQLVDQLIEAEVDAELSRWILACRRRAHAGPSSLRLDYAPKLESLEQLALAFLPERVEIAAGAKLPKRFAAPSAEAQEDRVCQVVESGTGVSNDVQNVAQNQAGKVRRPYSKPLARRRLASSPREAAGSGVTQPRSHPKAQAELELDRGGRLACGFEAEDTREAAIPRATAEDSCLPSAGLQTQASCSSVEASSVRMAQCVFHERSMHPAEPIRAPLEFVHLGNRRVSSASAPMMGCLVSPSMGSDPSTRIVFAVASSRS